MEITIATHIRFMEFLSSSFELVFFDRTNLFSRISDNNQHIQIASKIYFISFINFVTHIPENKQVDY